MIKLFYTILGITLFITASSIFAASFAIDDLNLREAIPNVNPPVAYFKIGLEDAWNKINGVQNLLLSPITVGILDTGVDVTHEEFKGVNFGNTPLDAKRDGGEKTNGVLESHGTNVAGIIGANNISGPSGVNYILPQMNGVLSGVNGLAYSLENRVKPNNSLEVSYGFPLFTIAKKINELSDDGSSVINFSQEAEFPFAWSLFQNIFKAHSDTLFVVAAGNGNLSVASGKFGFGVSPANLGVLPNVITVGATTIDDVRYTITQDGKTTGSNYGPEVSISAPGDSVYSPTFYHAPIDVSDYEYFSGTSASAPLVTGVASLLKAIKPALTPAQIKQILIRTADPIITDQPIGGRLNAYRAVCDVDVLHCHTANLNLSYTPNPSPISNLSCVGISPSWRYKATLAETADIGVTINNFTWDFYDNNGTFLNRQTNTASDFANLFNSCGTGSSHLSSSSTACGNLCANLGGRTTGGSVVMTFNGTDDNGNSVSVSEKEILSASLTQAQPLTRLQNAEFTNASGDKGK